MLVFKSPKPIAAVSTSTKSVWLRYTTWSFSYCTCAEITVKKQEVIVNIINLSIAQQNNAYYHVFIVEKSVVLCLIITVFMEQGAVIH